MFLAASPIIRCGAAKLFRRQRPSGWSRSADDSRGLDRPRPGQEEAPGGAAAGAELHSVDLVVQTHDEQLRIIESVVANHQGLDLGTRLDVEEAPCRAAAGV